MSGRSFEAALIGHPSEVGFGSKVEMLNSEHI
jgi:hypothetical protein